MIRVRNAVETTIASSNTDTETLHMGTTADTINFEKYVTLELDCTKTRLNKGDTLRVNLEWISDSVVNTGRIPSYSYQIRTDPEDRLKIAVNYNKPAANGETYMYAKSKQFKITIPFQLID